MSVGKFYFHWIEPVKELLPVILSAMQLLVAADHKKQRLSIFSSSVKSVHVWMYSFQCILLWTVIISPINYVGGREGRFTMLWKVVALFLIVCFFDLLFKKTEIFQIITSCHNLKKIKNSLMTSISLERVAEPFLRLWDFSEPRWVPHWPQMEKTWNGAESSQKLPANQNCTKSASTIHLGGNKRSQNII